MIFNDLTICTSNLINEVKRLIVMNYILLFNIVCLRILYVLSTDLDWPKILKITYLIDRIIDAAPIHVQMDWNRNDNNNVEEYPP